MRNGNPPKKISIAKIVLAYFNGRLRSKNSVKCLTHYWSQTHLQRYYYWGEKTSSARSAVFPVSLLFETLRGSVRLYFNIFYIYACMSSLLELVFRKHLKYTLFNLFAMKEKRLSMVKDSIKEFFRRNTFEKIETSKSGERPKETTKFNVTMTHF